MRYLYIRSVMFVILVLLTIACNNRINSKNTPVIAPGDLRTAIIKSLKSPFLKTDTLIVDDEWGFCGNSKPEEIPVIFDLKIDSTIYRAQLFKVTNQTIVTMKEYEAIMDTVLKYKFKGEYPESLWDTCRIGKTIASIHAEQISPTKVRLYEQYLLNDKSQSLTKEFNFTANRWIAHLMEQSDSNE
ncbi:hypothetical protein HQ865_22965 [Mucilaginibacter mali]|uniref:Lipoprotein n=1 Tax=Mucilaginibacter mali TaxID=2740462 RepID=A0A7D4UQC1_9SPHI|nr:hypothetical protein [Mucilaginibacter mali]QKJ32500.1 hypothetical protein HQ865_22965 [Mucilaginibacter mali]